MNASWLNNVLFRIFERFEKILCRFSKVPEQTFYDPKTFQWIERIEREWPKIRAELDDILKERDRLPAFHEVSPPQRLITQDDRWKTYFLFGYGKKCVRNCVRCPETSRVVESIPGMKTAFFSILAAGKHIPPHRGPYKGVLRYHLGLLIPPQLGACRIQVGNDLGWWAEGKSLVFDDTYFHQVWNDSDQDRAILFVDFERPLRFPFNVLNRVIIWLIKHTPYVRESWKKQVEWEDLFHEKDLERSSLLP